MCTSSCLDCKPGRRGLTGLHRGRGKKRCHTCYPRSQPPNLNRTRKSCPWDKQCTYPHLHTSVTHSVHMALLHHGLHQTSLLGRWHSLRNQQVRMSLEDRGHCTLLLLPWYGKTYPQNKRHTACGNPRPYLIDQLDRLCRSLHGSILEGNMSQQSTSCFHNAPPRC